jgi:hypothetical protein
VSVKDMERQNVLELAEELGVALSVPPDRDAIVATPEERVTDKLAAGIREHKPMLMKDLLPISGSGSRLRRGRPARDLEGQEGGLVTDPGRAALKETFRLEIQNALPEGFLVTIGPEDRYHVINRGSGRPVVNRSFDEVLMWREGGRGLVMASVLRRVTKTYRRGMKR